MSQARSSLERRIGHGSWRDVRWTLLVEPDGDERYLVQLIPESEAVSTIEVVGSTEAGAVREAARLP